MRAPFIRAFFAASVFAALLIALIVPNSQRVISVALAVTPTPAATPVPTPVSSTAPGTVIYNTATANYQDNNGTSYTSTSNQVSTIVQNAPSLVITTNKGTAAGAQTLNNNTPQGEIVVGDTATDVYTLTNTGNNSGYFQVGAGTFTNPANATLVNAVITCPDGTQHTSTTQADANTFLSSNASCNAIASNAYINIAITYTATATGTVSTTVAGATISYGSYTNGATGQTVGAIASDPQSNTYSDTVVGDAILDIQKSAGTISGSSVTYTIDANNRGAARAQFVQNMGPGKTITGTAISGAGILIVDPIPLVASSPVKISSASISKALSVAGDTATLVYTQDSTGKTGWTAWPGSVPAGSNYYVGVYITGTAGLPQGSAASSAGNVSNAQAQVEFTITLDLTNVAGATLNNIANSISGNNYCAASPSKGCIVGPTVPATTQNNGTDDPSAGISAAPGTNSGNPGNGWSQTIASNVPGVLNGPAGNPAASGCYDTSAACGSSGDDNNSDFTQGAAGTSAATASSGSGGATIASTNAYVTSDVKNTSGSADTLQLTFPALPSGVTVSDVRIGTTGNCSGGTSIWNSGTSIASTAVAANTSVTYCVTYALSNVTAYSALQVRVHAQSTNSSSFTNDTWHTLMPGGFIEIDKVATVISAASSGCPSAITTSFPSFPYTNPPTASIPVCPGGFIQYKVTAVNRLPSTHGAGTTLSLANNTLKVVEDGSAGSNNWTTYTAGLAEALVLDGTGAATCGSTGSTGVCGSTVANSVVSAGSAAKGSTSFTLQIGGGATPLALTPGQSKVVLYFSVQVK